MTYFVYYNDDYYENGGVGLEQVNNSEAACAFIEKRIGQNPAERDLSDYILIRGEELNIEKYEAVTKVKVVQQVA